MEKKDVNDSVIHKRQKLWPTSSIESTTSKRMAEVAGGVTADCATVWCCFPYTAANLLTLFVYKVPNRLCRKAIKGHRKRTLKKKGLFPLTSDTSTSLSLNQQHEFERDAPDPKRIVKVIHEGEETTFVIGGTCVDDELMELEKEMITKFNGFWRSHSQHET